MLVPSLPKRSDAMSTISIAMRSNLFAAAVVASGVLLVLLSPATASDENSPAVLTAHSPWLAPTGHGQPTRADVPQDEMLSAWEREQQVLDVELDRKLVICRGC
jgi:hypothetical protein